MSGGRPIRVVLWLRAVLNDAVALGGYTSGKLSGLALCLFFRDELAQQEVPLLSRVQFVGVVLCHDEGNTPFATVGRLLGLNNPSFGVEGITLRHVSERRVVVDTCAV
jgi:hypothetical protein